MKCVNCEAPRSEIGAVGWSVLGLLSVALHYCPDCSKILLTEGCFLDTVTGMLYDVEQHHLRICHTLDELDAMFPYWPVGMHDQLMWDDIDEVTLFSYELGGNTYYVVDSPWPIELFDYDPTDIAAAIDAWAALAISIRRYKEGGPPF